MAVRVIAYNNFYTCMVKQVGIHIEGEMNGWMEEKIPIVK